MPLVAPETSRRREVLGVGGVLATVVAVTLVVGALGGGGTGRPALSNGRAGATGRAGTASQAPAPTSPQAQVRPTLAPTTLKIGISLPISLTDDPAAAASTRDGALLAVKDARPISGLGLETLVRDDAVNGMEDPDRAAFDMRALAADPAVVGVVGANSSGATAAQIPESSKAGLLQCSPSAEWFGLTKDPTQATTGAGTPSNFVRVITPDDDQGYALANFATRTLGVHRVVIANRGTEQDLGQDLDAVTTKRFTNRLIVLGGRVLDYVAVDARLETHLRAAAASKPDAVFYAGSSTGAAAIRKAMVTVGLGSTPLLLNATAAFGVRTDFAKYLYQVGIRATNTYTAVSFSHDVPDYAAFVRHYHDVYGSDPSGSSLEAYACTQVVIEAIRDAAVRVVVDRAEVLATVTSPSFGVDTVLGRISFTPAGDMNPGNVSIYAANAQATDWDFVKQETLQEP